jgi:hypothetical protein
MMYFLRFESAAGDRTPTAFDAPGVVAALAGLLDRPEPLLRHAVLRVLPRFGPQAGSAPSALLALVGSDDPMARVQAVNAAGALWTADPRLVPLFERTLAAPGDLDTKAAIFEILRRHRIPLPPSAPPVLLDLLRSERLFLRALPHLGPGTPEALPLLLECARRPGVADNPYNLAPVLEAIAAVDPTAPQFAEAVALLAPRLRDEAGDRWAMHSVALQAAFLLLGLPEADALLREHLRGPHAECRLDILHRLDRAPLTGVSFLSELDALAAHDPDPALRARCAATAARIRNGGPPAPPDLLTPDPFYRVRP